MNPAPKKPDESTYSGRFAARLRMLREKRGLTAKEAAEAIRSAGYSLSERTYYAWESAANMPPYDALPTLAEVLGASQVGRLFPPK